MDLEQLVRPNIRAMKPYSSARDEFQGTAQVMLDANENSLGSVGPQAFNRYPDPLQRAVKAELAQLKRVRPEQIFLGNGSDEAIDLLLRLTCVPGQDSILVLPPTYGMYEVAANLNDVAVERVPLTADFQLSDEAVEKVLASSAKLVFVCSPNNPTGNLLHQAAVERVLRGFGGLVVVDEAYIDFADAPSWTTRLDEAVEKVLASSAKLVFVCSPNNPTGNLLHQAAVERVLRGFGGLVVVDEAYIDFADAPSWTTRLDEFPNLVVLQTFSKAWGMAGLRLGMAFASPAIIGYLNKIKPPYNISEATQQHALAGLHDATRFEQLRRELLAGRAWLAERLPVVPIVAEVFPSDANFLLARFRPDATAVYDYLSARGIVVRNRTTQPGCAGCLRLTVGTPAENEQLLAALRQYPA